MVFNATFNNISVIFRRSVLLVEETGSWQGVLYTTLCDKFCQVTCDRSVVFSVSTTNKPDRHDITEILSKVTLNTINQLNQPI